MIVDVLARLAADVKAAVDDGYYRRFADAHEAPTRRAPSLADAVRLDAPHALLAEIKPASPSKGDLSGGDAKRAARQLDLYQRSGVTGISVLTERKTFHGSLELLQQAAAPGTTPVLMKDFVLHEDQLDAAVAAGASAVLLLHHLIIRGDTPWDIDGAINAAHERGLEVLYEVDDGAALDHALQTQADLIGINNRDLTTLEMNKDRAADLLRHRMPTLGDRLVLALSGVDTAADAEAMRQGGAAGVLVGTSLMEAADPRDLIRQIRDTVHVKCCGTGHADDPETVRAALAHADAVGAVVDAGGAGRERTTAEAARLFEALPPDVARIVVTTQTDPFRIAGLVKETGATGVQVHHDCTPDKLAAIRAAVGDHTLIALQHLPGGDDGEALTDMLFEAESKAKHVDRLLLDARPQGNEDAGGTGRTLDREAAARVVSGLPHVRFILAGGLHPDNVADSVRFVRPFGVDTSSGIEGDSRGRKDPDRILRFIHNARSVTGLHDDLSN